MKLREISRLFGYVAPEDFKGDIDITRVVTSSELADRDALFYARDGKRHLARDTVNDAIAHGCYAVLTSSELPLLSVCSFCSNKARKMALTLEKHLFYEVLRDMRFVFVTGTKGKTTTAHMLAHILKKRGVACATCGTLGFSFGEIHSTLKNTTPDIFTLLPLLSRAYEDGARMCILEVSSQALCDFRIDGIRGEYAIFTGIGADHIDGEEHESFHAYREAKRRLFCDFGVTSAFSPRSASLAPFMINGVKNRFYVDTAAPSDLTLYPLKMSKSDILYTDGMHRDTLPLSGVYNLENAALALLCSSEILCVPPHTLYPALRDFSIAGRGERIALFGREILIDYAHNADSIEALARCTRPFVSGRMIAVCGAVGDKARARRQGIAYVLSHAFDYTVLTEDDTVSEKREDILALLYSLFPDKGRVCVVADREQAIRHALDISQEGDCVLLLGKGHERTLVRGGVAIPFSEREIVLEYFAKNTE